MLTTMLNHPHLRAHQEEGITTGGFSSDLPAASSHEEGSLDTPSGQEAGDDDLDDLYRMDEELVAEVPAVDPPPEPSVPPANVGDMEMEATQAVAPLAASPESESDAEENQPLRPPVNQRKKALVAPTRPTTQKLSVPRLKKRTVQSSSEEESNHVASMVIESSRSSKQSSGSEEEEHVPPKRKKEKVKDGIEM